MNMNQKFAIANAKRKDRMCKFIGFAGIFACFLHCVEKDRGHQARRRVPTRGPRWHWRHDT